MGRLGEAVGRWGGGVSVCLSRLFSLVIPHAIVVRKAIVHSIGLAQFKTCATTLLTVLIAFVADRLGQFTSSRRLKIFTRVN